MASHHLITLSVFCYLLILASPTPISAARNSLLLPSDSSDKVSLAVYYEALCPGSAMFIFLDLVKIFQNGIVSIVDLNLVPWGNAKILSNNSIVCQHGSSECLLNTIEACAIDTWPDLDKHFAFIYCVESMVYAQKFSQWETCFDKTGLDRKPIDDCYSSGHGKELELKYAAETNALKPPHEYVPWVVVNGQPLKDDYENFMSYICKAYKGPSPPGACKSLEIITLPSEAANNFHPVSYREEVNKPTISKI